MRRITPGWGRNILLTIVAIFVLAICQSCVPKSVDKSAVLFTTAAQVEQAFGLTGLPDMALSSAEEYRGVTTLCFELKEPADSVALNKVAREILADMKMERSHAQCDKSILMEDGVYANLSITCGKLYVNYGKSHADYPGRYLADSCGVVLPAHKAVSYGYAASNKSHWAVYEFDEPQSPHLTDSIESFSAVWLCPNADSTRYKVCRFYWPDI